MTWDWIAGFFEGEGHIAWREGKKGTSHGTSGRVLIGQVCKEPLSAIKEFLQQHNYKNPILYLRPAQNSRCSPCWIFAVNVREDVIDFLEHIRDNLFDKQVKADFVIRQLKKLNEERNNAIATSIALRQQGLTWVEIRRQTGLARTAIVNHMRAAQLSYTKSAQWDSQYDWRKDRIASGLCGCCGKPRGESLSRWNCLVCLEKRRVIVRAWKKKRRENDLKV